MVAISRLISSRMHYVELPAGESQQRKTRRRLFATKGRKFASLKIINIHDPPSTVRRSAEQGFRRVVRPSGCHFQQWSEDARTIMHCVVRQQKQKCKALCRLAQHAHHIAIARDTASTLLNIAHMHTTDSNAMQCTPPKRPTHKSCKGGSVPALTSHTYGWISEPP